MAAPRFPHISREGAEIVVLALIAGGVIWLLGKAIDKIDPQTGAGALDVAAFLLVLQAIITAIKDRWTQRGTDAAIQMVGNSAPVGGGGNAFDEAKPTGTEADPVHVTPETPGGKIG